ncbi:MAG: ADP-ribosylation/Crystallin [Microbacteriaceae bacterium]|nr:ADP-ribosylation/Crystallin [Microbacteriaceae bacterium]
MHDVLDARDLVPDEAEQLLHSGYPAGALLASARDAARRSDYAHLEVISAALTMLERDPEWPYDEPSDPDELLAIVGTAPALDLRRVELADRIRGAWLGRCVANTMGKPVEGLTRAEVRLYLQAVGQWPQIGYVPLLPTLPEGVSHLHESAPFSSAGTFEDVPRDDDIDWTILGLALLEEFGDSLTTETIAAAWLDRLPFTQTFTAERAVYRNVIRGIPVADAAGVENPYREWIGALIRADIFGYTNPANPARAARLALVDARFSHQANGIYGELWAAALVSAAFSTDSAEIALGAALTVVPPRSRLAEALREVTSIRESGVDAAAALDLLEQRVGHYNWVHTIQNAAHIAVGLLWGRDFTEAVAITISAGDDTDSAAATVGSVYGALHGAASIPEGLVGTTHVHVRSAVKDFDRITIDELAERTLRLVSAEAVAR